MLWMACTLESLYKRLSHFYSSKRMWKRNAPGRTLENFKQKKIISVSALGEVHKLTNVH